MLYCHLSPRGVRTSLVFTVRSGSVCNGALAQHERNARNGSRAVLGFGASELSDCIVRRFCKPASCLFLKGNARATTRARRVGTACACTVCRCQGKDAFAENVSVCGFCICGGLNFVRRCDASLSYGQSVRCDPHYEDSDSSINYLPAEVVYSTKSRPSSSKRKSSRCGVRSSYPARLREQV